MTINPEPLKRGETSFGIFYPQGSVLAVFPDSATAAHAADALRGANFAEDHLSVITGAEVLERHAALMADRGLIARFEQLVSRLYGDEADMMDELVEYARRDHTFVLVYAPEGDETAQAANAVRPLAPVVLRKYDALTITDLG